MFIFNRPKTGNDAFLFCRIEPANSLQACIDSDAKKVLLPITSAAYLDTMPPKLIGCFHLIFYNSAKDAVFIVLGVL